MFNPAFAHASTAYKRVGVETSLQDANPHHLVHLLFNEVLQCLTAARGALARGNIAAKGQAIGKSVRIIDEGLKAGLNLPLGGELAQNLHALYDYCVRRLTTANFRNDDAALQEVRALLVPVADAWAQIIPGGVLAKASGMAITPRQASERLARETRM